MFLEEASEALAAAKRIVESYGLEEFLQSIEARYALRYSIMLVVEALAYAITLVLEACHDIAPQSYRDAMLLAGEKAVPITDCG